MSRLAYVAVLIVVLGNVLFGLDWQSAPMSPMPDLKVALPSSSVVPGSRTDNPDAALVPAFPVRPGTPAEGARQTIGTGFALPSTPLVQPPAREAAPNCNVNACAAAYRSFQAADCSYQPTNGPRRRCTKR